MWQKLAMLICTVLSLNIGTAYGASNVDPCLTAPKSTAPLMVGPGTPNLSSFVIVPGVSGESTYVCSLFLTAFATPGGFIIFQSGTGTVCGTNTKDLTGDIGMTVIGALGTGTLITAPSGNDLCVVSTSGPAVSGFISFVQERTN
jgi:hypothetical protein